MKILCVGSNYAHHAREMGGKTPPEPIWFWKPESAIVADGQSIVIPPGVGSVHHEVELAIRIGKTARKCASEEEAGACIDGYTVAIDVTARELQKRAKKEGRPWAQAKGFDTFLPLGAWHSTSDVDLQDLNLELRLNDDVRQTGSTDAMTWSVAELVYLASQWTTLREGDILLTGTPEGVGPIKAGQKVKATVGQASLACTVV